MKRPTPQQITAANALPCNLHALSLLPPDWRDGLGLHLLALAQWGLDEGLVPNGADEYSFDRDGFAGTVIHLARYPVAAQLEVCGFDEDPDGSTLSSSTLEDAAQELLDTLWAELSDTDES